MPKEWTGNLVGLMHTHKITRIDLANKLGVTNRYVSMVLNGSREPKSAKSKFEQALADLIAEQSNTDA